MVGSAMLTTVASMKVRAEPSTVAASTHRARGCPQVNAPPTAVIVIARPGARAHRWCTPSSFENLAEVRTIPASPGGPGRGALMAELDRQIHAPARLKLMTALAAVGYVDGHKGMHAG